MLRSMLSKMEVCDPLIGQFALDLTEDLVFSPREADIQIACPATQAIDKDSRLCYG